MKTRPCILLPEPWIWYKAVSGRWRLNPIGPHKESVLLKDVAGIWDDRNKQPRFYKDKYKDRGTPTFQTLEEAMLYVETMILTGAV